MPTTYQQIEGHGPVDSLGFKTFIYKSKWGYSIGEKVRQCLLALSWDRKVIGGDRHAPVTGTGEQEAINYIDYEPPYIGFFRTTCVAEMKTTNASTQIRAVLKDLTAATTVWTSDYVNVTSWTQKTHVVVKTTELIAGHAYRLYFEKDNDDAPAFGIGWMDRL